MSEDQVALVVFQAGGRRCALPATAVREVIHYAELARPPGMPGVLDGFLNDGGEILPVLRLGRLFGLPEAAPGLYAPIVVLRHATLALLVDTVDSIVRVPPKALLPVVDASVFNGCVGAAVRLGAEAVHVLDADRLLLEQERRRIEELAAMVDTRLARLEGEPA